METRELWVEGETLTGGEKEVDRVRQREKHGKRMVGEEKF